jgi:uncharacterized protein
VSIKEMPVVFGPRGRNLIGMLHLPAPVRGRKPPCVVFYHGFTGNKHESHRLFVETARALARAGIASLRFDFYGCGDSAGEFSDLTVSTLRADAKAALRFARRQPGIDPSRIGLLGFSLGGMVASLMLGEERRIAAAVLWSPVSDPARLVRMRSTPESDRQLQEMGFADMYGWAVGQQFVKEMNECRPMEALVRTTAPVLLLHGDKDDSVPVECTYECAGALHDAGCSVQVQILPGADHTFSSLKWTVEVVGLTLQWFRLCLLGNDCK